VTFSRYHVYVEMVVGRDHAIALVALLVGLVLVVLQYVDLLKPGWSHAVAWILGVGGFYATLVVWAAYILSRPAGS
jgi:hypothetical protein